LVLIAVRAVIVLTYLLYNGPASLFV